MLPLLLCLFVLLFPSELSAQPVNFPELPPDYSAADELGVELPERAVLKRIITREEIEKYNAPDIATLLQEALDANVISSGPYGNTGNISLRGFDARGAVFLINGMPIDFLLPGELTLIHMDLNAVDRIEIYYGGADTLYNIPGSSGGVVNLITGEGQESGWRVQGKVSNTAALPGSYYRNNGEEQNPQLIDLLDTQGAVFSAGVGMERFSLGADIFFNQAGNHFLYRDGGYTRRQDKGGLWDLGGSAALTMHLPDSAKIIVAGDLYYGSKEENPDYFSFRNNFLFNIPVTPDRDKGFELGINSGWQILYYDREPGFHNQEEYTISVLNRWSWRFGERSLIMFGGDYHYSSLTAKNSQELHQGGLSLGGEFRLHDSLLIVPSIKAMLSSDPGGGFYIAPAPKLGIFWYAADFLTFRNNYYRIFKYPNIQELRWESGDAKGNGAIKPEDGWGGDLGTLWIITEWLNFDNAIFAQWNKDTVHWLPDPAVSTILIPQNVGETASFGADTRIGFDIPLYSFFDRLVFSLSYRYQLSYFLGEGYGFASDKRAPYTPVHTGGISLELPWKIGSSRPGPLPQKEGSLLISGHVESLRYGDSDNGEKLDPHVLLTVNLSQQISRNFSAFLTLRNALNYSYESYYRYPGQGFTLMLGLRTGFEGDT
ncbi:TonB-dependent receptor plug domain protein [Treponema primitia ZAS-2]|uniref:TonB-dependent receptor plug domain protein n=1 Tax=Treponema primitia (strain ATCC BAA-887 / DSM 12427 / ZAS-2) TaxID=545694 RepID=F5YL96_TREPZ|nr:TonB-dependent receptor [Treponema primitia]AEF86841.1 TonB-dependent receptor plug domain protein [Treponema primitia ZAS-2]